MSFGFAIYNDVGTLELSTDSTASLILDTIVITKGVNGSKNYAMTDIDFIPIITGPFETITAPGTGEVWKSALANISITGGTVTWTWDALVHSWAYTQLTLLIVQAG